MSNSLDPDQAQLHLGPNCLQGYQQMTKVANSGKRVNIYIYCYITGCSIVLNNMFTMFP